MQDMQVSELVARMRGRAVEMRITAEEYEIEARFNADKALDLRLGAMELDQRITFITEFVDGEPDETPAPLPPGSEVAAIDAAATSAGEAHAPDASPAPHFAAPDSLAVEGADPAKLAAEEVSSETSGEVQDRSESTSPPIPMFSRAGHIGKWVRTDERDQAEVDADNEEQDLVEVLADEKAPDPAPAGEGGASPAPTTKDRVKALHDAHPEYTARQAREALGITKGSLAGAGFVLGIKWTPEPVSTSKQQYRLRVGRGEGKYLHMSGAGLTSTKAHAWIGTEAQMVKLRQKFTDARDLVEEVVEKEGARA